MVVIYDRFVFFSVEKFFIPLLYSCLNILVQRSLRECVYMCVERFCVSACCGSVYVVCMYVMCASEGVALRENMRERKRIMGCRETEVI